MTILSLNGVNKHYGTKHALIDFDYEFTDGVYGLLGPNGAGKSTMMNIITQNIPCDSDSEILWNGKVSQSFMFLAKWIPLVQLAKMYKSRLVCSK